MRQRLAEIAPRVLAMACILASVTACGARVASVPRIPAPRTEAELACSSPEAASRSEDPGIPIEVASGSETVAQVRVEGNQAVPDSIVLHGLSTKPGAQLDPDKLDADLIRLHELGVFDDVRAVLEESLGGSRVVFKVRERPLIRNVFHSAGSDQAGNDEWPSPLGGDVYDAASARRSADELRRVWSSEGYLDARVIPHARKVSVDRVDLCFELSRGTRWEIDRISFPGARTVAEADLLEVLRARNQTANQPGKPWRPELMAISKLELSALLYDHGLVSSRVLQPKLTRDKARHRLIVEIPIEEGSVFHLGKVDVSGKLRGPRADYLRALGAKPGEVFKRTHILRGFERLQELHRSRGGKPEQVDREVATHDGEATVDLLVKVGG